MFEACQEGICFRVPVTRAGLVVDHGWLYLCKTDDLQSVLEDRLRRAGCGEVETAGVGADAVFQITAWRAARNRAAAREASIAAAAKQPPFPADTPP